MFTDIYTKDKEKFGNPSHSSNKVAEVASVSEWKNVLHVHAKLVEPSPRRKRK